MNEDENNEQYKLARNIVATLLGSVEANPVYISVVYTKIMEYLDYISGSMRACEKAIQVTVEQRDHAEDTIDRLCDAIGISHEWSSSYSFDDAVEAAMEVLK